MTTADTASVRAVSPARGGTTLRGLALAALVLFVFSIPYENGVTIPGIGSLARIAGFMAVGVVVLTLVERGRVRLRPASLYLALVAVYVLWNLASHFWSVEPGATMTRAATLIQLAAMVWMLHQVGSDERRRDVIAQAFVLGAYASIGVALAVFVTGAQTWSRDVGGLNPNWFAIGCSFAVPVAWGLALRARRPLWLYLNALYPAFAVFAVVLSASRGGFVTLLIALTVIPLTLGRLGLVRQLIVFVLVITAATGTFLAAPQLFAGLEANVERLQSTVDEIDGGTLTGRTVIWDAGVDAFMASPIVGHGYATFRAVVEPSLGRGRSAHNAFLSVAVGSGVIGLALFATLIGVVAVGVIAVLARRIEFLVIIATLIVGMVPANLENNKSVWFLLGWLAAARPLLLVPSRITRSAAPRPTAVGRLRAVDVAAVRSETTRR
jgi:O-antigen ligase